MIAPEGRKVEILVEGVRRGLSDLSTAVATEVAFEVAARYWIDSEKSSEEFLIRAKEAYDRVHARN